MRVAGYVRESADPSKSRTAFAQHEELRLHASEKGYLIVAACQDLRSPGRPTARDGYTSLLGVIAAGSVDAVLLPGVTALSTDPMVQQIAIWDLHRRGVRVLSTRPEDDQILEARREHDPRRAIVRQVLDSLAVHPIPLDDGPDPMVLAPDSELLVHIVAADEGERSAIAG
jgi:DNA invertase Pin-like site-specific DNA recombinase